MGLTEAFLRSLGRNQFEAIHVHQAEVGDLQVRNDREREKGQMQEGLGEQTPHGLDGGAQGVEIAEPRFQKAPGS